MIEKLLKYFGYIKYSKRVNYCNNCVCTNCSLTRLWNNQMLSHLYDSVAINAMSNTKTTGSVIKFEKLPNIKKEGYKRCQKKRKM